MESDEKSLEKCKTDVENEQDNHSVDEINKIVEDLADDYTQYLKINNEDEFTKFSTTVEEMLAKLDEFGGIVDRIRSDTGICMKDAVPLIQHKCNEMETVFQKIDNLEKFVLHVKENVAIMESELVKAEDQMGSFSGLKKMLSSFVSPKRTQTKITKPVDYVTPNIFHTEDFIAKPTEECDEAAGKT